MPFGPAFDLRALDGISGFRIDGASNAKISLAIVGGGDLNGDGIDDVVLSTPYGAGPRSVHVIYGRDGASGGGAAALALGDLTAATGLLINGQLTDAATGSSLSILGDLNGDGVDDLLIGAQNYSGSAIVGGRVYVLYGGALSASQSLSALDGTNGFLIDGGHDYAYLGATATGLGDINGDGLADFAYIEAGATPADALLHVVFGRDTAVSGDFPASMIPGGLGFVVQNAAGYGLAPCRLGDINDDGVDDFSLGAAPDGSVIVVFGRDTALVGSFQASYTVAQIAAEPGLRLTGDPVHYTPGFTMAAAGDVNGDGIDDMIVSNRANANYPFITDAGAYVVFGRASGALPAIIDLLTLDGSDGFRIEGADRALGAQVAAAGDVNGDGFDDVIVSGWGNGAYSPLLNGRAYVVFGGANMAASLSLADLTGRNGFALDGWNQLQFLGQAVSAAGDVNNDGIDDLMIQSPAGTGGGDGQVFLLYGQADRVASAAGGVLNGGYSHDRLLGGIGNDVLNGLAGDDRMGGGDKGDILNGGDGDDRLSGDAGGDVLYGGDGSDQLYGADDGDKLFGGRGEDDLNGGAGADRLDGGADADTLDGNDGNDLLDGGAGDDMLYGGTGNDIYLFQAGETDTAIELANEGYDIVRSWRTVSDLRVNIEALELQGTADLDGTGNAGANNLQGNGGANRLSGLDGVDTINGNDGDDVIIGGAGNDLLRGGTGADRFVIAQESIAAVLETDQVYDFSAAEGDWIDLSGIDAKAGGADDAFTLVGAFGKQAGQMTLTFAGGITTLRLDVNGDGKVDYQMKINGDVTGESGDWLL